VWAWCGRRFLAEEIGKKATLDSARSDVVPKFTEMYRDFTSYSKRKGGSAVVRTPHCSLDGAITDVV
jgi:hypothetical protein